MRIYYRLTVLTSCESENTVGKLNISRHCFALKWFQKAVWSLYEELKPFVFNHSFFSYCESHFMSYKPLHDCSKCISFSVVLMGAAKAARWRLTTTHPWTSWLMLDQLKEAADDPWKSGLLGWVLVISDSESILCSAEQHVLLTCAQKRDFGFWFSCVT